MAADDIDLLDLSDVEVDAVREFIEVRRATEAAVKAEALRRQQGREFADRIGELTGSTDLAVYSATQNTDLTEGKGGHKLVAAFLLPEDADLAHRLLDGPSGSPNSGSPAVGRVWLSVEDWLDSGGDKLCNTQRLAEWRTLGKIPKTFEERHAQPGGWAAG